jgi:hypothetical protein
MNRGPILDARVSRKAVWGGEVGRLARLMAVLALTPLSISCGDLARQGTGSSYLIVTALTAASGAEPGEFGGTLHSDVITFVTVSGQTTRVPTIFPDIGQVSLQLAMKDPGGAETPTTPTPANFITINRYRVRYLRADGRNTPGVDVPFGFDGAVTATVSGSTNFGFELVRHIAKQESPLRALAFNTAVIISTITEITFYGRDQTGREVSVSAQMLVDFGDFGDPD